MLGVDATYQHWGLPEIYHTANGVIVNDTIYLQASFGYPPISGVNLFKIRRIERPDAAGGTYPSVLDVSR